MIENLRKYTGLIIVAIALVFVGLVFLVDTKPTGSVGSNAVVTVDGRGYSQTDLTKLGRSPLDLARSREAGLYELMPFFGGLMGGAESEDAMIVNFFASRMVLRQAFEDFGIHPSDSEVNDFVRGMMRFQSAPSPTAPGAPGEFDQQSYNLFVQNVLGRFGLVERDFHELVRDFLATEKLREVVGGGLAIDRSLAEAMIVVNAQQVQAGVASIDLKAIREGIQPADEELKTYWETIKDAYQTEPRIKVSYVLAGPKYPEEEAAEPADEASTEEKSAEEAAAEAAKKAEEEAQKAEQRAAAEKQFKVDVDHFLTQLREQEGRNFDALVGESGWQVVSTDWFTPTTLPDELKALTTRGTSASRPVSMQLFGLASGPDPLSPYTGAIAVGTDQYLMARLDEREDAREKTFEEAREQVLERYVAEKAKEAVEKQVEEKTAAIKASIEAGKGFVDAAKEAGLEARELGPFAFSDTLDDEPNARAIFQAAATRNPGEFAEPIYLEDEVLLVRVEKRQVIKDDNRGQQVDGYVDRFLGDHENSAFRAWLAQRTQEADVKMAGGR